MAARRKHFISITDFTPEEIRKIYALTTEVKKNPEKFQSILQGKMFALIFEKPSTRTLVSFQSGIFTLGGGTIYLGPESIKLGVREEVRDVARVLNRYLSGVVLRTFDHKTIKEFERYFTRPVINGLSDFQHPCQALADFFTLDEKKPENKNAVMAFIGDGNNVLNSLILLAAQLGRPLKYATPKGHEPSPALLEKALKIAQSTGAKIEGTNDPQLAVKDADAIYTDVWVSMGEEHMRSKKLQAFERMQVNKELLQHAKPNALIMHCLPAHRGEEITDEVMESPNSIVFEQAENRMHVQKAILIYLCSDYVA